MLLAGPLLYPAGYAVGADPAVLIGAILGGSTFGDSISPVSDTTIASAGTQGADIGGVVRSRLKYVVPAGMVAMLLSALLSLTRSTPLTIGVVAPGNAPGAAFAMAVVPVIVIGLLLAKRHLLEGLLIGIFTAVVLSVFLGLLAPSKLLYIDQQALSAKGVLLDGMNRGVAGDGVDRARRPLGDARRHVQATDGGVDRGGSDRCCAPHHAQHRGHAGGRGDDAKER
jgi:Na+/H+ antiporter NhaC